MTPCDHPKAETWAHYWEHRANRTEPCEPSKRARALLEADHKMTRGPRIGRRTPKGR